MSDPPALSVIVAAIDGGFLAATLEALVRQRGDRAVEILVVANPGWTDPTSALDPSVAIVIATRPGLVPHLWGLGMSRARGSIVAITIAGCVPDPGWMDAVLSAYADADVVAVGGPIVPDDASSLVDRALVFARYGPYLPPVSSRRDAEVPGDNGSYRRRAIAADLPTYATDGFWEAEVNASLRRRGGVLCLTPAMRVRHTHSFGAAAFCRQRWQHGRLFGAARARRLSAMSRGALALAAPLTAALMTVRAARHAMRARLVAAFVPTLPVVVVFYLCWTLGEAGGLLRQSGRDGGR